VAPPGESRQRILEWLQANSGEIVDPSGRATPKLCEAVGYEGSMGAFSALLTAMDRDGQIVRDISGRRCSRIALPSAKRTTSRLPVPAPKLADGEERDLRELSMALLDTVMDVISAGNGRAQASTTMEAELDQLRAEKAAFEARVTELEARVTELETELEAVAAERMAALNRLRNRRREP
jgi:hypothetical protein